MGAKASDLLAAGIAGVMVGVEHNLMAAVPLEETLKNKHTIPMELYDLARSLSI